MAIYEISFCVERSYIGCELFLLENRKDMHDMLSILEIGDPSYLFCACPKVAIHLSFLIPYSGSLSYICALAHMLYYVDWLRLGNA